MHAGGCTHALAAPSKRAVRLQQPLIHDAQVVGR